MSLSHTAMRSPVAMSSSDDRREFLRQTARIDTDRARHARGFANGIDFALRHGTHVEINE
jgi:hypothetical protein